jgi:acetolactate synthase-1/3 small subunit
MKQQYTITVFTENHIGLLLRVTVIFTRRHVNIESLTASESEVHGVHRYTIVVNETREMVEKLVKQLEKQVEVFRAFYHASDDLICQEIALYKLPISAIAQGIGLEKLIRAHHARILTVENEFLIIELTGQREDIRRLFDKLAPFGILEFVCSGRVAIMKPMTNFTQTLRTQQPAQV